MKHDTISILRKNGLLLSFLAILMLGFTACSSDDDLDDYVPEAIGDANPAAYINDPAKLAMLHSIKDLDGTGRFYEVNYTVDYKLDQALVSNATGTNNLLRFVAGALFDVVPSAKLKAEFPMACSAFATTDPETGNHLMGRNYDFRHVDKNNRYVPIAAFIVHTAPAGGKRSISMVDGYHLGFKQGSLTDTKTDLSVLMGLPYTALDGINEDGFAMGVLALREKPTKQETGKHKIGTTGAIRLCLDRASTVDDAIALLRQYDMDAGEQAIGNYHFFMADATGKYAIVEYTFPKGETVPSVMEVFSQTDTTRYVTNFYVAPSMAGTTDGWGSDHGKWRYDSLKANLSAHKYAITSNQAMRLLETVSQVPQPDDPTSHTQWSALFNLTEKSMRLAILREYGKEYHFKVK